MGTRVIAAEVERRRGPELQSVARALDLLDALSESSAEGVTVSLLARRLGVDKSTISRSMSTLVSRGYAARLPSRRYSLGARSIFLAARRYQPLMQRAAPQLADIANCCGEAVFLLQLVGETAVSLTRTVTRDRRARAAEDGSTYPLWASAAGRALLSRLSASARLELLPPEPYPSATTNGATTWRRLDDALQAGRGRGYYAELGEIDPSLACYAVPIAIPGRPEGLALAISFDARSPHPHRVDLQQLIVQAAHRLGQTLVA